MKHNFDTLDSYNTLLLAISELSTKDINSQDTLNPALRIIAEHLDTEDITITLFDTNNKEIYIDSSYGLSSSQQKKGRYKIGEGIIGQVAQTRKKIIVPKISEEEKFLNKLNRTQKYELSFICVPIIYKEKITGTLSITIPYAENKQLDILSNILIIISRILIPPIVLRRKLNTLQHQLKINKKTPAYLYR